MKKLQQLTGKIIRGHGVASGQEKCDFPRGTIEMQSPEFLKRGLDLSPYFLGTLNISIAPKTFEILNPLYSFSKVEWTDLYPPEDFTFFTCHVTINCKTYEGLMYRPSPETKISHFQSESIMEVLLPFIEGATNDREVTVEIDPEQLRILDN